MTSENYWEERWKNNQMGWDIGYPSPSICHLADTIQDKKASILIPGCGNAYEARYLLDQGFTNITLLDISETAVNVIKERFKGEGGIQILNQDFFTHYTKYDYILEQTFFCALNPSQRKRYVDHMYELLNPNGVLMGLLFDTFFEKEGPPFGGDEEEYISLFSEKFTIVELEETTLSIPQRMGNELLFRVCNC